MPRAKFQTLTEPMFYILLCLCDECCGMDIMEKVRAMTDEQILIGPGTLYNLLEQFLDADMIRETKAAGRRRSYIITSKGRTALESESNRLRRQLMDYEQHFYKEGSR